MEFKNPFADLTKPVTEEWEGQFDCRHTGCYTHATQATYYSRDDRLEWTCPGGHENEMKYNE